MLRQTQHDNVNVLSNQKRNFMKCHANGVISPSRYRVAEKSLRRTLRAESTRAPITVASLDTHRCPTIDQGSGFIFGQGQHHPKP